MAETERGRIVLAGGSGFIGNRAAAHFSEQGFDVATLTRRARPAPPAGRDVTWDAKSQGEWCSEIDGAAAVVQLTGRSIDCRHTPENVAVIRSSRVDSTRAIGESIRAATDPPPVWVQASAGGYYGDVREQECTEDNPPGSDLLADVVKEWESVVPTDLPSTRVPILRIGVVLGEQGALPRLAKVTRFGLGGAAGDGGQYLSWIHVEDVVGIIDWLIHNDFTRGVYNVVSPTPITNRDFMATLRKVLNRPWSPPAPAFAVRWGAWLMGSDASLALSSMRCVPPRLLAQGYEFRFDELEAALRNLLES